MITGEDERLDDLQWGGLELIQKKDAYCFTSDAVLLANSVRTGARDRAIDLGAGSGILSILLAAKRGCKVTAVEFQPWAAELCRRNARLNSLEDKISVFEGDIKGCFAALGAGAFDVAVCNPPYYKAGSGETRGDMRSALSRHESTCTLSDLAAETAKLLREGGRLYMVYKTERLAEALTALSVCGLEPKELTMICPKESSRPDTFIVCAKKGGRSGIIFKNLVVYKDDGSLSSEAEKLYGKK